MGQLLKRQWPNCCCGGEPVCPQIYPKQATSPGDWKFAPMGSEWLWMNQFPNSTFPMPDHGDAEYTITVSQIETSNPRTHPIAIRRYVNIFDAPQTWSLISIDFFIKKVGDLIVADYEFSTPMFNLAIGYSRGGTVYANQRIWFYDGDVTYSELLTVSPYVDWSSETWHTFQMYVGRDDGASTYTSLLSIDGANIQYRTAYDHRGWEPCSGQIVTTAKEALLFGGPVAKMRNFTNAGHWSAEA